jgi:hypothetical protein
VKWHVITLYDVQIVIGFVSVVAAIYLFNFHSTYYMGDDDDDDGAV